MAGTSHKKVLLFGYLPPPYFGPSIAYESLLRSVFSHHFDLRFINLSVVRRIQELETFRLVKLLKFVQFIVMELWQLLAHRPSLVCYPISFNRQAFLKDSMLLAIARVFRVPIALCAHGTGVAAFRDSLSPCLRRRFDVNIRQASAVLVLAECLRSDFTALASAPDRVHVVRIGIAPQPDLPPRRSESGTPTILYLSALRQAKGLFDLLEAMRHLPSVRLTVAGDWCHADDQSTVLQLIRQWGIEERVEFAGPVWGEDKWRLLRSADVFVFPVHSQTEAYGIVLLEAMQAGAPIVTTRGGARDEMLIEGENAFFAQERNPRDLAENISRLLNDPAMRQRMSDANQQRFACDYTHEHYGRRMIEAFEALKTACRQGNHI